MFVSALASKSNNENVMACGFKSAKNTSNVCPCSEESNPYGDCVMSVSAPSLIANTALKCPVLSNFAQKFKYFHFGHMSVSCLVSNIHIFLGIFSAFK
jgi:hypothetical protein